MPALKERRLFISHAWGYYPQYWSVVNWFNEEPNFEWRNYSVPRHDSCEDTTKKGLKNCLTRQISPVQGVIILSGMYANHSEWIDYEIDEANRLNKIIIGVRPWGQERTPQKIQNLSHRIVNWNRAPLIQAIRDLI